MIFSAHIRKAWVKLDLISPDYESLMVGDFNAQVADFPVKDFCDMAVLSISLKNVHTIRILWIQNVCKSTFLLTNRQRNFQDSCVIETGLSDFLKVTVLKSYLQKAEPTIISYRNFKRFSNDRSSLYIENDNWDNSIVTSSASLLENHKKALDKIAIKTTKICSKMVEKISISKTNGQQLGKRIFRMELMCFCSEKSKMGLLWQIWL